MASQAWQAHWQQLRQDKQQQQSWRQMHIRQWPSAQLDFICNDYLGLARSRLMRLALAEGARRYGAGAGSSPMLQGYFSSHQQLAAELASWLGRDSCLLFSSGYAANLALMQSFARFSQRTFLDHSCHASLVDGLAFAPQNWRRYPHLRLDILEQWLARGEAAQRRLVVSETLFSMDGDQLPAQQMARLTQQHQALLILDDAHGIACTGAQAKGICADLDQQQAPLVMGSLAKALGGAGAFVVGPTELLQTVQQLARPLVYSTALSPAMAYASRQALAYVQQQPQLQADLQANIQHFRQGAKHYGLPLLAVGGPIQALILQQNARALAWAAQLEKQGILVAAIRPPTVGPNQARLRISISAQHSRAQIEQLLEALNDLQRQEAEALTLEAQP